MSNKLTLSLALVTAAIMVVFHMSAKRQPSQNEAEGYFNTYSSAETWMGKYPPDFELDLMNGEKFKFSDHVGKEVIVLNFFATWCGQCKMEMPELISYYEKHRREKFVIVGIDADEKENKVKDFIDAYHVTYPVGIDRDEKINKLFAVTGFPTTVIIGTDGTIKTYDTGPVMNADVAFDPYLKESRNIIGAGNGITKEAYLAKLSKQPSLTKLNDRRPKYASDEELTGRAQSIAEQMTCPCGCSDKVADCTCRTSKDIKKRLKTTDYSGKTDAEVIRELNKEFCVGSDKR